MKLCIALLLLSAGGLPAQVTSDLLLHADSHPKDWLTYSGGYASQRFSSLDQINAKNVKGLQLKWVYRPQFSEKMEATPLVVNGILYTVQGNDVVALDALTGRMFWTFHHEIPPQSNAYLLVVKGLAMSGDTLFWATYDGHLIAIDAKNGHPIWDKTLVDWHKGLQLNVAPLVVKDKVILGPATNEYGVNCWIAAYNVRTGNEMWRFDVTPSPGQPGNKSWQGDSWKHGGGSIWVTGSYDPETNLTFWGTGNPNPGWNGDPRPGDDLYCDSVVALDADTGQMKWYYQFTPHDEFDWDSVQVPVLANVNWNGQPRKVMLWANRNGFFYVLDRLTGKFLLGKAFVKQNWNVGFDESGRPIKAQDFKASFEGTYIEPGVQGGTNWYSPSFSPRTGWFYISTWANYSAISRKADPGPWGEMKKYTGAAPRRPAAATSRNTNMPSGRPVTPTYRTEAEGYGAVQAVDPQTCAQKWEFKMVDFTDSGILTTGSDLLFSGGREGNFFALNARTGECLWKVSLGGTVANGPVTYMVGEQQYVAVAGGTALYVFGLPSQ
jgi:alcohol dehydrogenase (cytochrome c)